MPHLCYDYTSEVTFIGRIDIPITFTLDNPWEVISGKYTVTIKGLTE